MRVSLFTMRYMDKLENILRNSGFSTVRTSPKLSLYMLLTNLVDGAFVSSVAALVLGLEPCIECPSVISNGKVKNVVLVIKRKREKGTIKLKVDKRSFTGRALAHWYLEKEGYNVVEVDSEEDVELVIGDEAREVSGDKVDLGEVWYEEFSAPLIYALFVKRRLFVMPKVSYIWDRIRIVKLEDVLDSLTLLRKLSRYWSKLFLPSSGLLGLLLRSL